MALRSSSTSKEELFEDAPDAIQRGRELEYFGWVYHLGVNSIGHEYCHLRFLLLRGKYVFMYKRDPNENPGVAVYDLSLATGRHRLSTDDELNLEGHRHRVRQYAHGLKRFIKIGKGPEMLI